MTSFTDLLVAYFITIFTCTAGLVLWPCLLSYIDDLAGRGSASPLTYEGLLIRVSPVPWWVAWGLWYGVSISLAYTNAARAAPTLMESFAGRGLADSLLMLLAVLLASVPVILSVGLFSLSLAHKIMVWTWKTDTFLVPILFAESAYDLRCPPRRVAEVPHV